MLSEPALLRAAVRNNADWCAAMARAHGLASRRDARIWRCAAAMPPFYPNAVTLAPEATARDLPRLAPGAAVKDSFRRLDLDPAGFESLFEARWIARDAAPPAPAGEVRRMATPAELVRWAEAWGETPAGVAIFVAPLLDDPRVSFLALEAGGVPVAGIAGFASAGVLGYSNAFGAPAGIAACIARLAGRAVVGYGDDAEVAAMAPHGFRPIGALRVWRRR